MSLLEEAKKVEIRTKKRERFTDEEIELAVAYVKNEILAVQVADVLKISHTGVYGRTAAMLKEGIRKGLIKLEFIKK